MNKEYLDVVNSKNKIVGRALRSICHQKGLWHRVSHVMVVNCKGNILVQKRSPKKDLSPNLWGGVGEHLKCGEDYLAGILRGIREELKFKVDKKNLEKIINYKKTHTSTNGKSNREFVNLYLLRNSGPFTLDKKEATANGFYQINNILSWNNKQKVSFAYVYDIKYYLSYRKKQKYLFYKFQKSGDTLWLLWENMVKHKAQRKGIKPLVNLLNHKSTLLSNKIVFDKIVGRAAALLLVYAGVSEVHTEIISQEAIKVFKKYKIYYQYEKLIKAILNQDKSNTCPFEKLAKGKTPAQFYKLVRNKL